MAVKELPPLTVWRTFAEGCVALTEEATVATQVGSEEMSLKTSGVELTEAKHY
jgi:hypothetical protein